MEIEIISGFLGAGKTTFLNKYLPLLKGKTAVIENEFGDVGLDGQLIEQNIPVQELFSGCICCSLAMDFCDGIRELQRRYHPDRILIEPSGVGRLSDIIKACKRVREKDGDEVTITKLIAMIDLAAFEDYAEDFGAFYLDQIQHARLLLLSNLEEITDIQKRDTIDRIQKFNSEAIIYEGDWRKLEDEELLVLIDTIKDYEDPQEVLSRPAVPAGKVFKSLALENIKRQSFFELKETMEAISNQKYGKVLRVKGILETDTGEVIKVDVTPYYTNFRESEEKESKLILIGCDMKEGEIRSLFSAKEKE